MLNTAMNSEFNNSFHVVNEWLSFASASALKVPHSSTSTPLFSGKYSSIRDFC
jgi:hypothetical protein